MKSYVKQGEDWNKTTKTTKTRKKMSFIATAVMVAPDIIWCHNSSVYIKNTATSNNSFTYFSMAYSEPSQTFKLELFTKIVPTKSFSLDVWLGSEYVADPYKRKKGWVMKLITDHKSDLQTDFGSKKAWRLMINIVTKTNFGEENRLVEKQILDDTFKIKIYFLY